MRTYPHNSPQAAARIVTLALLADGHLSSAEHGALSALHTAQQLKLPAEALDKLIREVCEDLLATSHTCWDRASQLDTATLAGVLSEIGSPQLRETVFDICLAAIEAEQGIEEGEAAFLNQAAQHWSLQHRQASTQARWCAHA